MNNSNRLNGPMNCLECNREFPRRASNQKYCVKCSNELGRKKCMEKYAQRKLKEEKDG